MPNDNDQQEFIIRTVIQWHPWVPWRDVALPAAARTFRIPYDSSGVYEARLRSVQERLYIGKADDLYRRVQVQMVRGACARRTGKPMHDGGAEIAKREDLDEVLVRWATSAYPDCIEAELHRMHVEMFGKLPKYVKR